MGQICGDGAAGGFAECAMIASLGLKRTCFGLQQWWQYPTRRASSTVWRHQHPPRRTRTSEWSFSGGCCRRWTRSFRGCLGRFTPKVRPTLWKCAHPLGWSGRMDCGGGCPPSAAASLPPGFPTNRGGVQWAFELVKDDASRLPGGARRPTPRSGHCWLDGRKHRQLPSIGSLPPDRLAVPGFWPQPPQAGP